MLGRHTDDGFNTLQWLEPGGEEPGVCRVRGCLKSCHDRYGTGEDHPIIRITTEVDKGCTVWLDLCWDHFENLIVEGVAFLRDIRLEPVE